MADETVVTAVTNDAGSESKTVADKAADGTAGVVPVAEAGGDQKQESKDGKADADKPKGAPEKYESFKLPEGMEIDETAMGEAQTVFKELGLSQDQAQKLIDLQAKHESARAEANQKAFTEMVGGWLAEAKADKEIGGEKFNEKVNLAKQAIDAFSPTITNDKGEKVNEFRNFLSMTGAGNHPEMIRFLAKVGEAVANDSVHAGRAVGPNNGPLPPERRMYPEMFKQQENA